MAMDILNDYLVAPINHDTTDSNSVEEGVQLSPKGRHHFTLDEDIAMLREVVQRNPFGARGQRGQSWELIEVHLRGLDFDCTMKSCQDRLARLVRTFISDDARKRSICGNTINNNPEMAVLLAQVIALKAEGVADGNERATKGDGTPSLPRSSKKQASSPAVAEVSSVKRTNGHFSSDAEDLTAPAAKAARFLEDADIMVRLKKQEIALKREELDLRKREMDWCHKLEEKKFHKEGEQRDERLRIDAEKNELERSRLDMDRKKQEVEVAEKTLEINERTQQLETIRQQQHLLFQLLAKKDGETE